MPRSANVCPRNRVRYKDMRITQLAPLIELPEQAQIGSCSALFNVKPFAGPLQLVHVVGGDLFLQRRILNHGNSGSVSCALSTSDPRVKFLRATLVSYAPLR